MQLLKFLNNSKEEFEYRFCYRCSAFYGKCERHQSFELSCLKEVSNGQAE